MYLLTYLLSDCGPRRATTLDRPVVLLIFQELILVRVILLGLSHPSETSACRWWRVPCTEQDDHVAGVEPVVAAMVELISDFGEKVSRRYN